MTKRFRVEFYISAGACIYGCLLLLLLPLNLVVSICTAAAIHEICHILMLYFYHVPILNIKLGIGGAVIQTAPLSPNQELICAAAGPLGSFLCLLLIRFVPLFALCGFMQGLFNLLPVYPLDGGRILQCYCLSRFPNHTFIVCRAARWCTIATVSAICILLSFRTQDGFYIILALYFLLRTRMKRKIPCKEQRD